MRLPTVITVLEVSWPGTQLAQVLARYSKFRQDGATALPVAEELARTTPAALEEIRQLTA